MPGRKFMYICPYFIKIERTFYEKETNDVSDHHKIRATINSLFYGNHPVIVIGKS
jgi:hypothetical protein